MGSMIEIKLNNLNKVAVVDDIFYDKIMSHSTSWSCGGDRKYNVYYAYAKNKDTGILSLMHHIILPCKHPLQVDHIDRNSLNNQAHNLRYVTPSQNCVNRLKRKSKSYSQYKGVSFDKARNVWIAIIMKDRKTIFGGRFNLEIDAAKKANELYTKHYKEYAILNNI